MIWRIADDSSMERQRKEVRNARDKRRGCACDRANIGERGRARCRTGERLRQGSLPEHHWALFSRWGDDYEAAYEAARATAADLAIAPVTPVGAVRCRLENEVLTLGAPAATVPVESLYKLGPMDGSAAEGSRLSLVRPGICSSVTAPSTCGPFIALSNLRCRWSFAPCPTM